MRTFPKALLLAATAIGCSTILAGPKEDSHSEPQPPELGHLDFLVGVWKVEQNHFDPSGAVVATATGTEEIAWILERHAIQRKYRTKTSSAAFEAIGLLTWSQSAKRFEGVWLDDASTNGPTLVHGHWNETDRGFVFELDAPAADGNRAKYKTVDRYESDTSRIATTYQLKGSDVVKISEVKYTRTTPCPAKLRLIWDD
jgi:hypothetical protein